MLSPLRCSTCHRHIIIITARDRTERGKIFDTEMEMCNWCLWIFSWPRRGAFVKRILIWESSDGALRLVDRNEFDAERRRVIDARALPISNDAPRHRIVVRCQCNRLQTTGIKYCPCPYYWRSEQCESKHWDWTAKQHVAQQWKQLSVKGWRIWASFIPLLPSCWAKCYSSVQSREVLHVWWGTYGLFLVTGIIFWHFKKILASCKTGPLFSLKFSLKQLLNLRGNYRNWRKSVTEIKNICPCSNLSVW